MALWFSSRKSPSPQGTQWYLLKTRARNVAGLELTGEFCHLCSANCPRLRQKRPCDFEDSGGVLKIAPHFGSRKIHENTPHPWAL